MQPEAPEVTVLVVSWNSAQHLSHCLDALAIQTYRDFELIIVDNGSTDEALDGLEQSYPRLHVRVERLHSNRGFAVANNIGARLARGKWLALLNPDAFPQADWLERLTEAAAQFPDRVFFASRQIQESRPELLDGEGDVYHVSGLALRRNYGVPVYPSQETREVFSACAAAALIPRKEYLDAGGFDEDYFAYLEDVDLGFRLRLRGLKCIFVPRAVVRHVGSASTGEGSDFAVYHGHRNLVWTFAKNMPSPLIWLYLPLHLLMNLFSLLYFSMRGRAHAIWAAKRDALRGLPKALAKRRLIQGQRRASIDEIRCTMSRGVLAPLEGWSARQRSCAGAA